MPDEPSPDETPTRVGPAAPPTDPGPAAPEHERFFARRRVVATVLWLLSLFITLALAGVMVWSGVLLAAFGLAGVALAVSLLMVLVSATLWRRAILPAAVLACALAIPAAGQSLSVARLDRTAGTLTARPTGPGDIPRNGYRRGVGTVFVDLRTFEAAPGSTTDIDATADTGRIVVALPRDRCFDLAVTTPDVWMADRGYAEPALELAGVSRDYAYRGSVGLDYRSEIADQAVSDGGWAPAEGDPTHLLAFGRTVNGSKTWKRTATAPNAPTLRLRLTSGQQVEVRDFPDWIGPLAGASTYTQPWPVDVQPPPSPGVLLFADRPTVRTAANRARWVAWERRAIAFGTAQAKRFAGACATREELAHRVFTFETQPESIRQTSGRVDTVLGGPTTRHSSIPQSPLPPRTLLSVEVNGLGQVRVIPDRTENASGDERGTTFRAPKTVNR